MDLTPVTLEGRYVRLEPLREDHADALIAVSMEGDLFRYFPVDLGSETAMRAFVQYSIAGAHAGTTFAFATVEKATDTVIGSTSYLAIDRQHKRLEIGGTWVAQPWQRTVSNTEAKYLQLMHCFEDLGCNRVEFKTDSLNERSQAALARIGAKNEGTFRNHMVMPDGRLRHSVYFSVIASEWPDAKARLEQMMEPRS